jgi:hypothetical protein
MKKISIKILPFFVIIFYSAISFSQGTLDPGVYSPILKGIKFGSTYEEILKFLRQSIARKYQPILDNTKDVAEADRLLKAMQVEQEKTGEGLIKFDGTRSGWDVSVIKDEFMHNTQETMLPLREGDEQIYLFFINGIFWKIVIIGKQCAKLSDCVVQLSKGFGPPSEINFMDPETRQNPSEAIWETLEITLLLQDRISLYKCIFLKWVDNKTSTNIVEMRGGQKSKEQSTEIINKEIKDVISPGSQEDVSDVVDDILGVKKEGKKDSSRKPQKKKKK